MRKNNMFRKLFFVSITVLLTFFLLNGISIATQGHQNPALNWGSTSGLDAILPPPGMYLSNYVANYSANDLLDEDGHNLKLPGGDAPELDLVAYAPQFIYVHEKKSSTIIVSDFNTFLLFYNPSISTRMHCLLKAEHWAT